MRKITLVNQVFYAFTLCYFWIYMDSKKFFWYLNFLQTFLFFNGVTGNTTLNYFFFKPSPQFSPVQAASYSKFLPTIKTIKASASLS